MIESVKDHGAAGDGSTSDHAAIQKAIDTCHEAGGGVVLVPPGRYLCGGTLALRSGVTVELARGAVLVAVPEAEAYLPHRTILYAEDAVDFGIVGHGTVQGCGEGPLPKPKPKSRARTLLFQHCRNVCIEDATFRDSDSWALQLFDCDTVRLHGLRVLNDLRRINADGIDPVCCCNVFISDCLVESGDDAIVLKTTDTLPCENITITNCILRSHATAIKLGTESRGDIRHVTVSNCVIRDSDQGIGLFMRDGAIFEDLLFSNISIITRANQVRPDIVKLAREWPLLMRIDRRAPDSGLGRIRDVSLQNIHVRGKGRCWFKGEPERPIENLSINNLSITPTGPMWFDDRPGNDKHPIYTKKENYRKLPAYLIAADVMGFRLANYGVNQAAGAGDRDIEPLALVRATGCVIPKEFARAES